MGEGGGGVVRRGWKNKRWGEGDEIGQTNAMLEGEI